MSKLEHEDISEFSFEELGKVYQNLLTDLPDDVLHMIGQVVVLFGMLEDRDATISETVLGLPVDRKFSRNIEEERVKAETKLRERLGETHSVFRLYGEFYASFGNVNVGKGFWPLVDISSRDLTGASRRLVDKNDEGAVSKLSFRRGPAAHGYLRAKRVRVLQDDYTSFVEKPLPYFYHAHSNTDFYISTYYRHMYESCLILSELLGHSFVVEAHIRKECGLLKVDIDTTPQSGGTS